MPFIKGVSRCREGNTVQVRRNLPAPGNTKPPYLGKKGTRSHLITLPKAEQILEFPHAKPSQALTHTLVERSVDDLALVILEGADPIFHSLGNKDPMDVYCR